MATTGENLDRFSGFADLYDTVRPVPPAALGRLLAAYAGTRRPAVVDLGSGTGLSTRWAATWAASVVGVEPNDDMRAVAESRPAPGVTYRKAVAQATGLPQGSADVVVAVQSLHWMDPEPTLAEVTRVLRPGGVLAAVDADMPPVTGNVAAERAWAAIDRRFRAFEVRVAGGERGEVLRRPLDEPTLAGATGADGDHRPRGPNSRSWDKQRHLARMEASGRFAFTREVVLGEAVGGGADRYVALLRSHGTYQELGRLGLTDADLGVDRFEREVRAAFAEATVDGGLAFSWRARLGVTPP